MTHLGVVGATGAVGRTMLTSSRSVTSRSPRCGLFASARSAGDKMATAWGEIEVEDLETADPAGLGSLCSLPGARTQPGVSLRAFVEAGAVVIDNSSAFRMDRAVPLVVAGVNDHALEGRSRLIANPNCTTMTLMMAAAPLHHAAGLARWWSPPISRSRGRGGGGSTNSTARISTSRRPDVAGLWRVGGPRRRGLCPADRFQRRPARRGDRRVRLHRGGMEAGPREPQDPRPPRSRGGADLCAGPGDGRAQRLATLRFVGRCRSRRRKTSCGSPRCLAVGPRRVPTPLDSAGSDEVLVGRVRRTMVEGGINLCAIGDNLRKGAALNAVQMAERVLKIG